MGVCVEELTTTILSSDFKPPPSQIEMAPNPHASQRPCLFVSEREIPPWKDRVSPPVTPVHAIQTLRSPGFRAFYGVLPYREIQTIHEQLRHLYVGAMTEWRNGFTGHPSAISATRVAWMAFLDYVIEEEHIEDFLEDKMCSEVRAFLSGVLHKLQSGRLGADPAIQKRAAVALKVYFVAPTEWE